MNKRLTLILVLMSACVAGITGLQLFWNYQNYNNTIRNFTHDINESLTIAADNEMAERHQKMIGRFKHWLADTSFITITADNNNRHHQTVFHMKDAHPLEDSRPVSMSIESFKESIPEITPEAKAHFVEHFGNTVLLGDLKKGIVYFYTQRLGDSLGHVYNNSKVDLEAFGKYYRASLNEKGIHASFQLNSPDTLSGNFMTRKVNTAIRAPYYKEYVYATFIDPNAYFLKEMKWVIVSSFLLIIITIFCFGYTVKTLLSQDKLARLKDDFIHNMTHELNTPISAIRITAESLRIFNNTQEKQREYVDIISQQAEKLTTMTDQIMNIDRLVNRPNEWKNIRIADLIQRAVDTLSVRMNSTGTSIDIKEDKRDLVVSGDFEALANAFTNILDNAIKYSPQESQISIRVTGDGQWATIAFADKGEGIAAEYRDKVFDKFFRVPKGKVHNVKGYGLGLSYVRQVIKNHHGNVSVSDNQPRGTIFTVTLPVNR